MHLIAELRRRPTLLVAVGLIANLAIQPWRALRDAPQTDYVGYATGARLVARGGCLYCDSDQAREQTRLLGFPVSSGFNRFVHPAVDALLLRPLAGLSLSAGLALLLATSLIAVLVSGVLLARMLPRELGSIDRAWLAVLAVASLPAAWSIALGQLDALALVAVCIGVTLMSRAHPGWGGAVMSMALVKPQLVWLVPVVLLGCRAVRPLLGFCAGAAAVGLGCLAVAGGSVRDWAAEIGVQEQVTHYGAGVGAMLVRAGAPSSAALVAAAVLAAGGVAILLRRRGALTGHPLSLVGAGVALSLLASPHLFADDLMLAAVPIIAVAQRNRRLGAVLGVAVSTAYAVDQLLPAHLAPADVIVLGVLVLGCCGALDSVAPARRRGGGYRAVLSSS